MILPMRNSMRLLGLILFISLISCSQNQSDKYSATYLLNEDEQQLFVYDIIRYAGKLVSKASHESKFNQEFDMDYWSLAREHSLDFIHIDNNTNRTYFSVSRIAPSIHIRKVSVGGYIVRDENREIVEYVEVFRTWKMPVDELSNKTAVLFELLVNGKDMSKYMPDNAYGHEYIEFPNATTYFDSDKRLWVSTLEDPVGELKRQIVNNDPSTSNEVAL